MILFTRPNLPKGLNTSFDADFYGGRNQLDADNAKKIDVNPQVMR